MDTNIDIGQIAEFTPKFLAIANKIVANDSCTQINCADCPFYIDNSIERRNCPTIRLSVSRIHHSIHLDIVAKVYIEQYYESLESKKGW